MGYKFENQRTSTAAVLRDPTTESYMKLKGINGKQENASNFRTAVRDLIDVGNLTLLSGEKALVRNIDQAVVSDGQEPEEVDPQLRAVPSPLELDPQVPEEGFYIESPLFEGNRIPIDVSANTTLTGKKMIGMTVEATWSTWNGLGVDYTQRTGGYTVGTDSITITAHVPAFEYGDVRYKASTVDCVLTGITLAETEDIT